MPTEIKQQVAQLSARCSAFSEKHGAQVVEQFQKECALLIQWLSYLSTSQRTNIADTLLDGATSSIRETAACLSLGLVRPALFALRTQVDLILAWLYFKDHPVEWRTVNAFGEGYKLKREILEYLAEHYKGFSTRFSTLKDVSTRSTEDPYRLLSAHVHAQSMPVLPVGNNLVDVVRDEALCTECTVIAREVCEYVSDLLCSVYSDRWAAMPSTVQTTITARLAGKKGAKEKFFGGI